MHPEEKAARRSKQQVFLQAAPFLLALVIIALRLPVVFGPPAGLERQFINDDAFFYFKIAENIASGHGSTFDGINPTNGYHPLWMLVCTPIFSLAPLDRYLPLRILTFLLALLNAGNALYLLAFLKKIVSLGWAMLGVVLWAFHPEITLHTTFAGLETGLYAFFLLALLYHSQEYLQNPVSKQQNRLVLLAILVLYSRLDSVMLLLPMGLWLVISQHSPRLANRLLAQMVAITAVVMAAWMIRMGVPRFYELRNDVLLSGAVFVLAWVTALLPFDIGKPLRWQTWLFHFAAGWGAGIGLLYLLHRAGLLHTFSRSVLLLIAGGSLVLLAFLEWLAASLTADRQNPIQAGIWRENISLAVKWYGEIALALALYSGINVWLFGTPLPVSGQIKEWWGLWQTPYGRRPETVVGLFGLGNYTEPNSPFYLPYRILSLDFRLPPIFVLLVTALLAWLLYVRVKKQSPGLAYLPLLPLSCGALLLVWNYTLRGYVGWRGWYWPPIWLAFLLLLMMSGENFLLRPRFSKHTRNQSGYLLAILLLAWFSAGQIVRIRADFQAPSEVQATLRYLRSHTTPGSLIGMTGGGTIGYFLDDRTIVNMDGLVNSPAYFAALKNRTADTYLTAIGLDYVFGQTHMLTISEPYTYFLPQHLEPVAENGGYGIYAWKP